MKAPRAPDPYATANAQAQMNQQTANYTQGLNQINQVTPYGNLTYSGVNNGQPGSVTATTTLSPEQEAIRRQGEIADAKMNDIAVRQIDKVGGVLDTPFSINSAAEDKITGFQRARLDPQWAEREQQFEQEMANRGIRVGSGAYEAARRSFDQGRNDAYNSMYVASRGQAANEAVTERNQPINEITALLNGQQLQNPNFVNTPNTQVANTDLAGLVMDNYKSKQANYAAGMGGLFGLGGSLLTGGGYLLGGGNFFGKK